LVLDISKFAESMVDASTFEKNIAQLFAQEYDDETTQKVVNAYKMYIEEYHADSGFNFELIQKDISQSGQDEDPSQSMLYATLLKSLQTKQQFQTEESQNKLYSLLVSLVNGLSISQNRPWTSSQANKQKPKKRQSTQADIVLEDIDLENDVDDEKKEQENQANKPEKGKKASVSDKQHHKKKSESGDGNEHEDGDDLSDLE